MSRSIACIDYRNGKVFIAKRQMKGDMGGRWEFPGGKIDGNEDFETAIKLEAKVTASIDRYAEENLKGLEDEVLKETGKGIQYYQFTGTFSVEGIEDLQGKITTLIVVVDDTQPYIYDVRVPVTEVESKQNLQWTQLDASASINAEKKSARVAAMGYVTIEAGSDSEKDSNTLYPEFVVLLP